MKNVSFHVQLVLLALQSLQALLSCIHHAVQVCLQLNLLVRQVLPLQRQAFQLFHQVCRAYASGFALLSLGSSVAM